MRKTLWLTAVAAWRWSAQSGPDGAAAQTRTTLDIYVVGRRRRQRPRCWWRRRANPLDRYRQRGAGRRDPGRRADHGGSQGRRPHADRQPDHYPLARRSLWRHGGACQTQSRSGISSTTAPTCSRVPKSTRSLANVYPQLYATAKHTVAKAGDKLAVAGLDVQVVTVGGRDYQTALPGAGGPETHTAQASAGREQCEDPMSVGVYVTFGKVRHRASWRPHQEQGIRADVPQQPPRRHRRSFSACITA